MTGTRHPAAARDPGAPLRLPRAIVVAVAATLVGAVSHLGCGGVPDAAGAACAVPVLAAPAWPLTGRERGWLPIRRGPPATA